MAFVGTNTMHSEVRAMDKHRASLLAGEPLAQKVDQIVTSRGYVITKDGKGKGEFAGVNTLRSLVMVDEDLADRAFAMCCEMAHLGGRIPAQVVKAIFHLDRRLKGGLLQDQSARRILLETGVEAALAAIRRNILLVGKGGELVAIKAILDLVNVGRRKKLTLL